MTLAWLDRLREQTGGTPPVVPRFQRCRICRRAETTAEPWGVACVECLAACLARRAANEAIPPGGASCPADYEAREDLGRVGSPRPHGRSNEHVRGLPTLRTDARQRRFKHD